MLEIARKPLVRFKRVAILGLDTCYIVLCLKRAYMLALQTSVGAIYQLKQAIPSPHHPISANDTSVWQLVDILLLYNS